MIPSLFSTLHRKGNNELYQFLFFCLAKGSIGQRKCMELYNRAISNAPFDVVIIPGAPYNPQWNEMFRRRLNWSLLLQKSGIVENIIYSGGAVHSPWIEAEAMSELAELSGIPKQNIFQETKAEHTVENLFFGIALARSNGFSKIAFASDPVQCRFIQKFLPHTSTEITLIPIVNKLYREDPELKSIPDLMLPIQKDFKPLGSRKSILQMLSGTLGRKYLK